MAYMPHEDIGKLRKLALPHHGPYRVLDILPNGLSLHPVNYPEKQPILVNQDCATKCPTELHDVSWFGKKRGNPKRKMRQRIRQSHLPSRLDMNFVNDHETPMDVHCAEPRITDY